MTAVLSSRPWPPEPLPPKNNKGKKKEEIVQATMDTNGTEPYSEEMPSDEGHAKWKGYTTGDRTRSSNLDRDNKYPSYDSGDNDLLSEKEL